jgi:hypothetical protein
MRAIILTLILSAGVAGAELTADEFNEVRNRALTGGFYYAGTCRIGELRYYTFLNQQKGLVGWVPIMVTTSNEAMASLIASSTTFYVCGERWKKPLNQFVNREVPLPPVGYELDYSNDGVVCTE